MSRSWPPHTMVGIVGATIGGTSSIGWPMPTRKRTESGWS